MTDTLSKLAIASALAILIIPPAALAGRGGGARGGYGGGNRGGGGYGGGYGGNRGGGGYGGGQMGHSPSFSQPSSSTYGSRSQGSGAYGNRTQTGSMANSASRNPYASNTNAAAGAGHTNSNQGLNHPAAAGAAGGAADTNRNQSLNHPGAAGAAAGAGYSNRNQGLDHPGAAGAAGGAAYSNRNQGLDHPGAAGAAAGAGYANRDLYNQYHPGMGYGNYGNYGAWGTGGYGYGGYGGYGAGVGAWGMGSPMYGWGYSNYNNAYYGLPQMGAGQLAAPTQARIADQYDYSQPLSTTAAAPAQNVTDQASGVFDQAREAFKQGNYAQAIQLNQQALGQMPNDPTLHEFLALAQFAQGQYDQAAPPLFAVLSTGPGWNWTTLIGNYADANVYTQQLRALEAYLKANPQSAPAHFVLGYHYLTQGHNDVAAKQYLEAARLQPTDKLSAQLAAQLQPAAAPEPPATSPTAPSSAGPAMKGTLSGRWVAAPAKDAQVALTIQEDGGFTWGVTAPGKPAMNIAGKSTFANGMLTLADQRNQNGALAGKVTWQDENHFTFQVAGGGANDPGLSFAR